MMITMASTNMMAVAVSLLMMSGVAAFTIHVHRPTPYAKVVNMIDKNIADMIDQEYYRQHHMEEYHQQWMERNQPHIQRTTMAADDTVMGVSDTYQVDTDSDESFVLLNRRQMLRDEKLARTNPQQYCMDRCISTGYCDVYEDYFDFTPEEVVAFCTDCVLASEETEECTVPDAFYDHMTIRPNTDSQSTFRP